MNFREHVYLIIRCIPAGQVASYGQIAALAGFPGRARHVGAALAESDDSDLPWYRVVNSSGRISLPGPERQRLQAELLRAEGVKIDNGRVPMRHYRWQPSALAFAEVKGEI